MDSLGYFGKWFPTEHKKYTAIIAMMYVGVVTTVLGILFEFALRGLAMIGLFGGPVGIRRTMDVLTFFSGLNTLVSLALLVIMLYLLYKTRALVYLLKMVLGYFVVDLLLILIADIFSGTVAALLCILGIIATIYVNRRRWHYISKYRRYIYYVVLSWLISALCTAAVVGHIVYSMTQLMFGMTRGGYGTFIGYAVLLVLVWMIPVFCQHYIYRREERMGTSFYQAFRLMNTVPWTAVFFIFGISSLASIGTISGENMFTSFDFDDTGDNQANLGNRKGYMSTQSVNRVNEKYCPHCGRPLAADAVFCSHCGKPVHMCPKCHQPVDPSAKFCPSCGAQLQVPEAQYGSMKAVQSEEKSAQPEMNPVTPPILSPQKKELPLKVQLQAHGNLIIALACVLAVAIAGGVWYAHEQKAVPAKENAVSSQPVKTADSELSLNGVYLGQSWDEAKDNLGRELSTSDSKDGAVHHKFTDMDVVVKDNKVIMLTSSSPAAQSKRGIHQGSSFDDVVNAYGDDYQASEYGAQIHYEYTFKTDDGKPGILRFAVSKNSQTVEYISVRLTDEQTDGAKQAFLAYHKAISGHHLQEAFQLLTPDFQTSVGSYDGYAPGYANTLSSDVSNIRKVSSGGDKTMFSFTLKARDRIPGSSKVKVQYFNGQVTMVKEGDTWKISDMSAKKTGEHVE
ncbi:zinc-ribbon domain-containing protein [Megasphaera elsdenii]|uniref:zinc-ribbon domain-containing protein n=1 Tax=Megasphaera elsdenii TaxID=907 RepID=UPI001D02EBBF|nr:zinc-ribbon domain-containing protein [Megasphaera elsdenii]MCB5702115.1 zinc-ribbon domain-containing protein [Megasphaera elsdenii]MCB5726978.1 zinc-ribbon domain-containing protein [Megasphaera elsdenii]MCB5770757.1 zinc-ribbon domain-containing protein [Megasphaera elsdenii]